MRLSSAGDKILTIDIGGSHIKSTVLSYEGETIKDYEKIETPDPATPENVIKAIEKLVTDFPAYDFISIGFPGYVKNGVVHTAPNLGNEHWANVNLSGLIEASLKKPVQLVNDADLQGVGIVSGKGLEMMVTLGTGFGTAILIDGHLLPHLELSRHPVSKNRNYDEYIGDKALEEEGLEKWNTRVEKCFDILKAVFNYDRLYISGGNAKKINFKLDDNITVVSNREGIKGGAKLWQQADFKSSQL